MGQFHSLGPRADSQVLLYRLVRHPNIELFLKLAYQVLGLICGPALAPGDALAASEPINFDYLWDFIDNFDRRAYLSGTQLSR